MGLDITAYRGLVRIENPAMEDGCPVHWEAHFHAHNSSIAFTEENWPGHSEGIESDAVYAFADKFGFRAGSYGGYNAWRNQLAEVMLGKSACDCWKQDKAGPFFELIHFADNEGVIGPKVAAKLAKDFADHEAKATAWAEANNDEWFIQKYRDWRKAFEMAAQGGAVDFH